MLDELTKEKIRKSPTFLKDVVDPDEDLMLYAVGNAWNNLKYFLEQIIPVAEEVKIKMAIHPDDPPWPIFGLPRIITNEENLDRFLKLYESEYNGLTLCTGSLGVSKDNNMPNMIRRFGKKIHFAHLRNVKIINDGEFQESAHMSKYGSLDFVEIMKAYHEIGF